MSNRLTVKEFAIRAGVSPQRIYKLLAKDNGLNNGLSNRLKPYIIIEDNQKYLDIEALKLFEEKANSQQVEQRVEQRVERTSEEIPQGLLIEQLKAKDSQIAELTAALKAEQEHSAQKDERIQALTDKAATERDKERNERQAILTQLFSLQAKNTELQTELNKYKAIAESKQTVVEVDTMKEQAPAEEQPTQEPAEDPAPQKLSFFQRLFKRK